MSLRRRSKKATPTMSFIIGLFIGSALGALTMALMVVSK